jgi:hypothetical protein
VVSGSFFKPITGGFEERENEKQEPCESFRLILGDLTKGAFPGKKLAYAKKAILVAVRKCFLLLNE